MKIIQLNAWLGNLMSPLLQFIDDEKPDILCSQEVLSSKTSIPIFANYQIHEQISKKFAYQFFAPTFSFESFGSETYMGNVIYSRFPIKNQQTFFSHGEYLSRRTVQNYARNVRNLLLCSVSLPGNLALTVANHQGFHDLDPAGTDESVTAMKRVVAAVADISGPFVFCGDLNVNPKSQALKVLDTLHLRNLSVEHKLPTTLSSVSRVPKPVVCDYVLVNDHIRVQQFRVSDELVSDHKALLLEFAI